MMIRLALLSLVLASPAVAEVVVPLRTIRARELITHEDLTVKPVVVPGAIADPAEAAGMEARVALYAGRPVRPGDVGPPALIARNELVTLRYSSGGLHILTEGRALERGAVGEIVRVMNLASRATVFGLVHDDGSIEVR